MIENLNEILVLIAKIFLPFILIALTYIFVRTIVEERREWKRFSEECRRMK
jgi:hypothetical protein